MTTDKILEQERINAERMSAERAQMNSYIDRVESNLKESLISPNQLLTTMGNWFVPQVWCEFCVHIAVTYVVNEHTDAATRSCRTYTDD